MKTKQKKLLFIAALASKKLHFDGERNKSSAMLRGLQLFGKVDVIDLSDHKLYRVSKLILMLIFKHYDKIILAKPVTGANIALSIMRFLRIDKKKIFYFLVGFGFSGFEDRNINMENIAYCNKIICEANAVVKQLNDHHIENCLIFPCVKEYFSIPQRTTYQHKEILKLIFFSRVVKTKGIFDLLDAFAQVNSHGKKFELVIAGSPDSEEDQKVKEFCVNRNDISYLGQSFSVTGIETYEKLAEFDLHVFPTKNVQECIPGSIVDFFIAGVPTLSSMYPSVHEIIDEKWGYFYEYGNTQAFVDSLLSIYDHQEELFAKRGEAHKRAGLYSTESFVEFIKENILK